MKKLFLFCVIAVLAIGVITAKESNNVKTTVFTSSDIYCQSCANKIMNNVPTLGKGIEDVKVDVQNKTVTVKYNADKNNDQNIIKGLKKLDVNAMVATGDASQGQLAAKPYCTMPPAPQQANQCQPATPCTGDAQQCTGNDDHCQAPQATACTGNAQQQCTASSQQCNTPASASCCGGYAQPQGKNK